MPKILITKITTILFCCGLLSAKAQGPQIFQQLDNLIVDAVFLTNQYVSPATDAAVYQSSSCWVNTAQKAKLWDFTIGIHGNNFNLLSKERTFKVSNNELAFFKIQNTNAAVLQSALGNNQFVNLVGQLNGQDVSLKSPEGVNSESISYPFAQASLGMPFGTELIARYAPKTHLKNVVYQVYGVGLKYNLSQFFMKIEAKNIYFSTMLAYSNENVSVKFLDVQTNLGNLGLNSLNSDIKTIQGQVNVSKKFNNIEFTGAFIVNSSDFRYQVDGDKGEIENIIPIQDIVNSRLLSLDRTEINYIGEASVRFKMGNLYVQTTVSGGKFLNSNIALQYQFVK